MIIQGLKKNSGISLIQVSMIIIIFGLFIVPGLAIYKLQVNNDIIRKSDARINTLVSALQRYAIMHGRYPAPADRNLAPGHPQHGQPNYLPEIADDPDGFMARRCSGTGNDAQACWALSPGSRVAIIGALPVDELAIPPNMMIDGWGGQFTYAVSWPQTLPSGLGIENFDVKGTITVQDASGEALANPDNGTGAHFVIFSHGKDQKGTYSLAGVLKHSCTSSSGVDQQNCLNEDATFTNNADTIGEGADSVFESKIVYNTGTGYFDDYVGWANNTENDIWSRVVAESGATDVDIFTSVSGNVRIGGNELRGSPLPFPRAKIEVHSDMRVTKNAADLGGHLLMNRYCPPPDITDGDPIMSLVEAAGAGYNTNDPGNTKYVMEYEFAGNTFIFLPRRHDDGTLHLGPEGQIVPMGYDDATGDLIPEEIQTPDGSTVLLLRGLVRFDDECMPTSTGTLEPGRFTPGVFNITDVDAKQQPGNGIHCDSDDFLYGLHGWVNVDEDCEEIVYDGPDVGQCAPGEVAIGFKANGTLNCIDTF